MQLPQETQRFLKPSAYSPYVSDVICLIIKEIFDPAYVSVVTGGRAENNCLLKNILIHTFLQEARLSARKLCAKPLNTLNPRVTLELGGKKAHV